MKTMMKTIFAVGMIFVGIGFPANGVEKCPVFENVRGHENVEWQIAYAFHLTDEKSNLPRVLLVGDSICNGYQGEVRRLLDGKMNVSYWISSYTRKKRARWRQGKLPTLFFGLSDSDNV